MFHTTGYLPRHTDIMSVMSDEVMNLDDAVKRTKNSFYRIRTMISIIIPVYNVKLYLDNCIQSVIQQSYTDFECILVDDGSTDNSVEVISSYDEQVHVCVQQNQGVVKTRNKAISLAKDADYLVQLDADDYLDEHFVENMVSCALKESADLVYCQVHYFGRVEFDSKYPEYNLEKLKHENYMGAYSLLRMAFIIEHDLEYDEYLGCLGYEDWDFALGACLSGAVAARVDESLYFYRKHMGTASRNDAQENDLSKILLVRHHIWQKYNHIYPSEFCYFSAEIDILYEMISQLEAYEVDKGKYAEVRGQLEQMQNSKRWRYSSRVLDWMHKFRSIFRRKN